MTSSFGLIESPVDGQDAGRVKMKRNHGCVFSFHTFISIVLIRAVVNYIERGGGGGRGGARAGVAGIKLE